MKSTYFFVKSNYIKNTKKNWVFCECRVFYHQNITFLHIQSVERSPNEAFNRTVTRGSNIPLSILNRDSIFVNVNILLNLLEFRCCEIKSVNFNSISKFAIKLIPSGFISSKKIYLLPEIDDDLTEWCGLISGFIMRGISMPVINSSSDNSSASAVCNTVKAFEVGHNQISKPSAITKDTIIPLDDNDAYEAGNESEYHLVTIEPTETSKTLDLQGKYLFRLADRTLELLNIPTREVLHHFPYSSIRRFGASKSLLRLETGRRCSTGCGNLTFTTEDAEHIVQQIHLKARLLRSSMINPDQVSVTSSMNSLNRPMKEVVQDDIRSVSDSKLNSSGCSISYATVKRMEKIETTEEIENNDDDDDGTLEKQDGNCNNNQDEKKTEDHKEEIKKRDIKVNTEIQHERSSTTILDLPPPPPPPVTTPPQSPTQQPISPNKQYHVTQSSFFRYRQMPTTEKISPSTPPFIFPPSRSITSSMNSTPYTSPFVSPPPQTVNSNAFSETSHQSLPSTSTFKKSPNEQIKPAVLPKPKINQDNNSNINNNNNDNNKFFDTQKSFRELDEMLKDLDLTYL